MRIWIGCLASSTLLVALVACQTSESPTSPTSSSSGGTSTNATRPTNCLERCEAAAAKCGGADESFCADACAKYTETQLVCMEDAGCNRAAIAACTSAPGGENNTSSSSSGSTTSSGGSTSGSGGTTTTISCSKTPNEKDDGEKCDATCTTITVNGRDFCAKRCASDDDCPLLTRCTVNGSEKWCARTCSSHTICKSYGFTTCATGYAEDPTESVCAY